MPSPAKEAEIARVLARAAEECESQQTVWLGPGLPQALKDSIERPERETPAEIAFLEIKSASPNGATVVVTAPPVGCRVVGLSSAKFEELDTLIQAQDSTECSIDRLICPFALFDFGPNGLIVREIRHGLTAADLQQKLDAPLWAGPDLKELGTH